MRRLVELRGPTWNAIVDADAVARVHTLVRRSGLNLVPIASVAAAVLTHGAANPVDAANQVRATCS